MEHISYTQINMFLRCPRQYEYRYVEGKKIPPTGAMVQSRAWHETVEYNYKQKTSSYTDLSIDDMKDFFADKYDFAIANEDIMFEENEDPDRLKDQGLLIVETHHKQIAPSVIPSLVEEPFEVSIDGTILSGRWDLVDVDGIIVDNKAYSKSPTQDDVDKDLQLSIYSLAYRESNIISESGLRLDTIIKTTQPKTMQIHTTRSDEDCEWVKSLIAKVSKAIRSGVFYPNPCGWHCSQKFCGYWDICKKNNSVTIAF